MRCRCARGCLVVVSSVIGGTSTIEEVLTDRTRLEGKDDMIRNLDVASDFLIEEPRRQLDSDSAHQIRRIPRVLRQQSAMELWEAQLMSLSVVRYPKVSLIVLALKRSNRLTHDLRPSNINPKALRRNDMPINNDLNLPDLFRHPAIRAGDSMLDERARLHPRMNGNLERRAVLHSRDEGRQQRRSNMIMQLDIALRAELFDGNVRSFLACWEEQDVPVLVAHGCCGFRADCLCFEMVSNNSVMRWDLESVCIKEEIFRGNEQKMIRGCLVAMEGAALQTRKEQTGG